MTSSFLCFNHPLKWLEGKIIESGKFNWILHTRPNVFWSFSPYRYSLCNLHKIVCLRISWSSWTRRTRWRMMRRTLCVASWRSSQRTFASVSSATISARSFPPSSQGSPKVPPGLVFLAGKFIERWRFCLIFKVLIVLKGLDLPGGSHNKWLGPFLAERSTYKWKMLNTTIGNTYSINVSQAYFRQCEIHH